MSNTDGEDTKQNNLLPCPFCGSHPEWINEALPDSHYYIRCPHCQFVMKEDRRDKVIGFWNNRTELASLREQLAKERGKSQRLNDDLANALDVIEKKEVENGELLKALEYGELELRTTYERFTNYKGSSSLWNMQNVLKKYKNNLSA